MDIKWIEKKGIKSNERRTQKLENRDTFFSAPPTFFSSSFHLSATLYLTLSSCVFSIKNETYLSHLTILHTPMLRTWSHVSRC